MKTFKQIIALALFGLLWSSCGGGSVSNNEFLGKLPGISAKYENDITELEVKLKECTDMEKSFEYDKKIKLQKEEGKKAIKEYVETNEFPSIPFVNLENEPFEILKITVKSATTYRLNFGAIAKVKEDLKNKYGGFEKHFFARMKAVDKEGNMIGKPGVMMSSGKGPFTAGLEVEMSGSIDPLYELENFDKIVFITQEEYDAYK